MFKVENRKASKLLAYIANKVFKQEWTVLDESEPEHTGETDEHKPHSKKPRRQLCHLDYVLPHRSAISKMVESFSLLSFTDMAESIEAAREEQKVVTYSSDDSLKAAGRKMFDVKTAHVTIIGPEKQRETFTSGFYENVSHSGLAASKTVQHDIAKMAVLTGNTYNDMMSMINFFMNDRAVDGDTMLDQLCVDENR